MSSSDSPQPHYLFSADASPFLLFFSFRSPQNTTPGPISLVLVFLSSKAGVNTVGAGDASPDAILSPFSSDSDSCALRNPQIQVSYLAPWIALLAKLLRLHRPRTPSSRLSYSARMVDHCIFLPPLQFRAQDLADSISSKYSPTTERGFSL